MKKKILWKLNIVDIVVILAILAVGAFFASKFLLPSGGSGSKKDTVITYVVEVPGMDMALYEQVASRLPCRMAASGKWVDGDILSVRYEPCEVEYLEISSPVNSNQKQWLKANKDIEYVTAYFTCEGRVFASDMFNMVGTQEIRVGRNHYLKGVDVELIGTIVSMEKAPA